MSIEDQQKADAFIGLMVAAMKDAAIEKKMTQFKTTITPEGTGQPVFVRIIIVPEAMEIERPEGFRAV